MLAMGDALGNGMPFRLRLPSGLEIVGLPTKNSYGGDWDLGPTWNYLVLADKPFLVDTGRTGTGKMLLDMMELAGFRPKDLDHIILSHGHEDHDGGLAEIMHQTGARAMAHRFYSKLIRFCPEKAPSGVRADFPPSCWHCFMPEEFTTQTCVDYHRARNELKISEIGDGRTLLQKDVACLFLPGHSPDALTIIVGNEAVFLGDTVLPEITPSPTRRAFLNQVNAVLDIDSGSSFSPYGLITYIRSLKRLKRIGRNFPEMIPLPGHRLFSHGRWCDFVLEKRVNELIAHHVDRCADIMKILADGPKTARQIALRHFDPNLLKGYGIHMAENETLSHCELLAASGDIVAGESGLFEATGYQGFESLIASIAPNEYEN
jgi:glyoxylase-like metal-dependent hydrolase (beta-lactamase superfamily II)